MGRLALFVFFLTIFLGRASAVEFKEVCIRDVCLRAEVARSDPDRRKGLMFRQGLAEDEGMLFIFDEEKTYAFWMKNMLISLDIIWISSDKKIVDIHKNVQPCQDDCPGVVSVFPSQFVLEVKSGFAQKHNLAIGDSVEF